LWAFLSFACVAGDGGFNGPPSYVAPADDDPDYDISGLERRPSTASDFLFELDQIHEFDLQIPPQSWDALLVTPREYQPGTFTYEDQSWEVGIRLKGQVGSFRALDSGDKSGFKVDFNRYDPDGNFFGLKKLTLNNMVQDPGCTTDRMGYQVFESVGVKGLRAGYAWVRVNDVDFGLYLNLESADKTWIRRRFDDPDGNLYEGTYRIVDGSWTFADFLPESSWAFDHDIIGDPADQADLQSLVMMVQNLGQERMVDGWQDIMDYDGFLHFVATEVFLTHWDGYCCNTNNYRFYFEPTEGRFYFLPWGIDQTFRPSNRADPEGYGRPGILFTQMLEHPEAREHYLQAMAHVADAFEELPLEDEWQRIRDLIIDAVYADPKIPNKQRFENFNYAALDFIQTQSDWMRQFLPEEDE